MRTRAAYRDGSWLASLRLVDDRLRRAQRRAKTGDLDDEVALLVEQLRAGALPPKKLRQRAQKGDAAARRAHRLQYAGSRTYTAYRPPRWCEEVTSLDVIGGGWNQGTTFPGTLLPGDRLVPIRVEGKKLLLYGATIIDAIEPVGVYRRRPDARSTAGLGSPSQVVSASPEHALAKRVAPRDLVDAWCYQTPKGEDRPLKHRKDGEVLRHSGMDGVFLLSDATARAVLEFLASS
jgi:hypothetical protein